MIETSRQRGWRWSWWDALTVLSWLVAGFLSAAAFNITGGRALAAPSGGAARVAPTAIVTAAALAVLVALGVAATRFVWGWAKTKVLAGEDGPYHPAQLLERTVGRVLWGRRTCSASAVPRRSAAAILESLLRTYEDQHLLDGAVQQYIAHARANRPNRLEQLAAVEAEMRKADEALDRYFNAFETGSMSEEMCRPRIERLAERLRGLRARQAELTAAIEDERITSPDPHDLEVLKAKIREALLDGPIERRKAILQELVAEVWWRAEAASGRPSGSLLEGFSQCPKWCNPAGVEPTGFGQRPNHPSRPGGNTLRTRSLGHQQVCMPAPAHPADAQHVVRLAADWRAASVGREGERAGW